MKEAKRRARSKKGAPHATFEIAHDVRDTLGKDVGLRILERSDMLTASTLEQLRKSTDRAYTLFGFLMTAFSAVTGPPYGCKRDLDSHSRRGTVDWSVHFLIYNVRQGDMGAQFQVYG